MGKSGKTPSHLVRIGTIYHYRRAIPPGLSGRIGMREIKVTLRTSILEEAREREQTESNPLSGKCFLEWGIHR